MVHVLSLRNKSDENVWLLIVLQVMEFFLVYLQGAWDALWMAQESKVITAIPVIGREMSKLNWARGRLVQKMEEELQRMQKMGMALRHFVDVNMTVVDELKMEGVDRLAAEKLSLVEMERELEERIRSVFV